MSRAMPVVRSTLLALTTVAVSGCQSGPAALFGDSRWVPDDAIVVFQDDFDGDRLDSSRWNTCHWWSEDGGCTIASNPELQWYRPENVGIGGSMLRLEARIEDITNDDGERFAFTSGMVTTGPAGYQGPAKFAFLYGGAEARIRVPAGAEFWPAFWLLPASSESRPEIDIMEMNGDEPNTNDVSLHSFDEAGERLSWRDAYTGPDFTAGWHDFAVRWTEDEIVWLVDGVPVSRLQADNDEGIRLPTEPLYLVLNLAVDGEPNTEPAGPRAFPAAVEVDWVQVWQVPGERGGGR